MFSLSLLFVTLQDWSQLKMALACPIFLFVIVFYFLPESPRWLLLNGRVDEAREVLEKALKVNNKVWPEGFELEKIEPSSIKETSVFVAVCYLIFFDCEKCEWLHG
jgi:OCT family organic cation transporter-like MFS transporter 1